MRYLRPASADVPWERRESALVCPFRVLGFHRVPPVSGRVVNITSEIKYFANDDLLKTFFTSPGQSLRSSVF